MTTVGQYRVAGLRVQVLASDPVDEAARHMLADLEPSARGRHSSIEVRQLDDGRYRLDRDGRPGEETVEAGLALVGVLDVMNAMVAEHWSRRHVALHAATVEREGRALALVGHSGAGKTTLAAAAVRAGWGYVGDEAGLVDDSLVVHAYHRPLGLRRGGRTLLGLPLSDEPWHRLTQPEPGSRLGRLVQRAPLAAVVFLRRTSVAAATQPQALSPAAALADLLNNVLGTEGVETKVFRRLERMVRSVPIFELGMGAPHDMLVGLEAALAASGAQAGQ